MDFEYRPMKEYVKSPLGMYPRIFEDDNKYAWSLYEDVDKIPDRDLLKAYLE